VTICVCWEDIATTVTFRCRGVSKKYNQ